MSFREIDEVFDAEMDDSDDVELLKDFGIDIEGEGIVIVHRGYAHINDRSRVNPGASLTNGFDDVLERAGRYVVTVKVDVAYSGVAIGPDTADFNIEKSGEHEGGVLDRSAYERHEHRSVAGTMPDFFKP